VPREQELHVDLASRTNLGAVGTHDHAIEHGVVACGHQLIDPLHLNDADPACADLVEVLEIAQGGDVDVRLSGGVENGRVLGHAHLAPVDGYGYHCSILPPRKAPNPKWSQRRHLEAS